MLALSFGSTPVVGGGVVVLVALFHFAFVFVLFIFLKMFILPRHVLGKGKCSK